MNEPKTILIHYLSIYKKKKDLRMRPIVFSMKKRLEQKSSITEKQFFSIVSFIEREGPFRGWNRKEIFSFFTPIIEGFIYEKPDYNTLEQFFTETV
jgi:hypothetical protein